MKTIAHIRAHMRTYLALAAILVIASVTRFYQLGNIPAGLTNDEANNGYDAYAILKTGRDQWGDPQPYTYLKGFGDYRLPLYTYSVIPSVAIFGLNEFAVRFPSAVFGVASVFLAYVLGWQITKRKRIGLTAAAILALNPWHIAMSRVGIESNLGVLIFEAALLAFLYGLTRPRLLIPAAILFVATIYTYTTYTVFTPLFILAAAWVTYGELAKHRKLSLISIALFFLLLVPLLSEGRFKTAQSRATQVNFLKDKALVDGVSLKRAACQQAYPQTVCQILENKPILYARQFAANYLNHFSPAFLAIHGADNQYSALPKHGLIYVTEFLLFIVGLYFLFAKRTQHSALLVAWLALAPLADSATGDGHYSRYLVILPAIQLTAAYGAVTLVDNLRKIKPILAGALIALVLFEFVSFAVSYTSYFPAAYARYSHYGYKVLFAKISTLKDTYDNFILSSRVNDTKHYIFYLFYNAYDPALYQSRKTMAVTPEDNGWLRVARIDSLYFVPAISIPDELVKSGTYHLLLIGAPGEFSEKVVVKYAIRDHFGKPIFYLIDVTKNPDYIPNVVKQGLLRGPVIYRPLTIAW